MITKILGILSHPVIPIITALAGVMIGIIIQQILDRPRLYINDIKLKYMESEKEGGIVFFDIADIFNNGKSPIKIYHCFINDKKRKIGNVGPDIDDYIIKPYNRPLHWEKAGFFCNKDESEKIIRKSKIIVLYQDFINRWYYSEGSYENGTFHQGKQARWVNPFINIKLIRYITSIKADQSYS